MSYRDLYKIYETNVPVNAVNVTGAGGGQFSVESGSRIIVTLSIIALDLGASVQLVIRNGFGIADRFTTLETINAAVVDDFQRVYADFNTLFDLQYVVTGGNATFKVAVTLNDNAGTTTIENAQLNVNLDANPDSAGHHDSVRIGSSSGNELQVNPDGSINTVVEDPANSITRSLPDEALQVASGSPTDILTYTVPVGKVAYLIRAEASGENFARFDLALNGTRIATRRSNFGDTLNVDFDFTSGDFRPFKLAAGDELVMTVLHLRPYPGDFEARFQVVEVG